MAIAFLREHADGLPQTDTVGRFRIESRTKLLIDLEAVSTRFFKWE